MVVRVVERGPSSRFLSLVLLTLLVLSVVPLSVAPLELSDEYNITDSSDREYDQRAAVDPDGNFHIIHLLDDGGDYSDLMYRRVSPSGMTLVGPLQISPSTLDSIYGTIALAVDTSGRSHIAFSVKLQADEAVDVYYAQVSSLGSVQVSARSVHTSDVDAAFLDIETDESGNVYVVWNERTAPPTIMWMKLSPSGSVLRSAQIISGDIGVGGDCYYPRLGASSSGVTYVTWEQKDNAFSRISIYYTSLDPSGSVEVDPVEVQSSGLYDLIFLEATADSHGDLHLTYVQNEAVRHTVVDDRGRVTLSEQVASTILGQAFGPDVAVSEENDVHIVWSMTDNPRAPRHQYIRVRWDANDTWSDPEQVNQEGQTDGRSVVAVGSQGAGVVFNRAGDLHLVVVDLVEENRPPVARLTHSPTTPEAGELVTFNARGSSDPDEGDFVDAYHFDYGDGVTSGWIAEPTVVHSYSETGSYTASLRVQDSHAVESEFAATVTFKVVAFNEAPHAYLSADPTTIDVGGSVTFDGRSSIDPDGTVESYEFDFGDGNSTGWVGIGVQSHSYERMGVFTATLRVRDNVGEVSENVDAEEITVQLKNRAPTAVIDSISPNPAAEGEEVTFVGTAWDPDGSIEVYAWRSDVDGIIGTEATVYTRTLSPGIHTISFMVMDNEDLWSGTVTEVLTVKANRAFTLVDLTEKSEGEADRSFEFKVRYIDPDNDAPTVAKVWFEKDGKRSSGDLLEVDPTDFDYTDGKEYYFKGKLGESGMFTYWFEFNNAMNPTKESAEREIEIKEAGPGFAALGAAVALAMTVIAVRPRRSLR
jgi:hypothetical protein